MSLNLNQIFTGLIVVLFLGMGGYIIYLQHQVNKTIKEQREAIYNQIDSKFDQVQSKIDQLTVNMDSLKMQNDSIKIAQYESYKINQQAKEQADRAISAYRDLVFQLPEY